MRLADLVYGVDDRLMSFNAFVSVPTVTLWASRFMVFSAGRWPAGVGLLSGTGLNAVAT